MKIAYINKKAEAPKVNETLELAYMKDIRIQWNRNKEELQALGLDEIGFVSRMRSMLEI
jgi:hypothetical protein